MKACSVSRRALGGDGYLTKRSAGKSHVTWSTAGGTSPIADTVMAAAVAIVQGHVAADAIAGTGTMKTV